MNLKRMEEIRAAREGDLVKEIELSTGDKIELKGYIPLVTKRAIAKSVAMAGLIEEDGRNTVVIDWGLITVARNYSILHHMTNMDIDEAEMEEVLDILDSVGLLEGILNQEFIGGQIKTIDELIMSYIEEEKRQQELEGTFGHGLTGMELPERNYIEEIEGLVGAMEDYKKVSK